MTLTPYRSMAWASTLAVLALGSSATTAEAVCGNWGAWSKSETQQSYSSNYTTCSVGTRYARLWLEDWEEWLGFNFVYVRRSVGCTLTRWSETEVQERYVPEGILEIKYFGAYRHTSCQDTFIMPRTHGSEWYITHGRCRLCTTAP